jgi:hypothetical protein
LPESEYAAEEYDDQDDCCTCWILQKDGKYSCNEQDEYEGAFELIKKKRDGVSLLFLL